MKKIKILLIKLTFYETKVAIYAKYVLITGVCPLLQNSLL